MLNITAPAQPSPVTVESISGNFITVSYTPVYDGFPCCEITNYVIKIMNSGGFSIKSLLPSETSYSFLVTPGTAYNFTVKAVNEHHEGPYSASLGISSSK